MSCPTVIIVSKVTEERSGFWVTAEIGPFATHAEAWSYADKHSDEGRAAEDHRRKIGIAFAGNGSAPSKNSGK